MSLVSGSSEGEHVSVVRAVVGITDLCPSSTERNIVDQLRGNCLCEGEDFDIICEFVIIKKGENVGVVRTPLGLGFDDDNSRYNVYPSLVIDCR